MIGITNSMKTGAAKRTLVLALFALGTVLIAAALFATQAYAADKSSESSAKSADVGFKFGNDFVWLGETCVAENQVIDNDFVAAGKSIRMENSLVGGSIRAAGQDIVIDNVVTIENVSIAGETISVENGSANGVILTGRTARFSGESSELRVYAERAVINGVVHGDASVSAQNVEIGPNAVIEGTLHVTAASEPDVPKTAKVGKLDVSIEENSGLSTQELENAMAGFSSAMLILSIVLSILGALIIALLAEWLFKRHTAAAAEMIRTRTGATIGTGIVAALVAPIVIIVLCCLVITLPVAGALTLALIAMTIVATGFMGASVFKLAFPKLGRFQAALAGGAIMGVASAIPFLGSLVAAAAFMYLLGYVLQTIFLSLRKSPDQGAPQGTAIPPQRFPQNPYAAPAPGVQQNAYAAPVSGVQQNPYATSVQGIQQNPYATPVQGTPAAPASTEVASAPAAQPPAAEPADTPETPQDAQ